MEIDSEPSASGSIVIITNGSTLHPVSCSFDADVLARWQIPFVQAHISFNGRANLHKGEATTVVVHPPFMSETDTHLLYWFHHLLNGASSHIAPKHLWMAFQLYDFLYGSDEHPHMQNFLTNAKNTCCTSAAQLDEADYASLRQYHQHRGTQWPTSTWTYEKDNDSSRLRYKSFGEVLFRHQEWDLLVAHGTALVKDTQGTIITYPRRIRADTNARLDQLTGGVWSVLYPFLGEDFQVDGPYENGFVWSQLCEDDRQPEPGMALSMRINNIDKERELFALLSTTHKDRCIVAVGKDHKNIFINDAPVKIRIAQGRTLIYDLDLQEYVYRGGDHLLLSARGIRAWNRRQVYHFHLPQKESSQLVYGLNLTPPDTLVRAECDNFLPLSVLSMATNLKILRLAYPTYRFFSNVLDVSIFP
jgi:hypothetical protein